MIRELTHEEFLACKLEADNAVNWTLRAPHLNIITDNSHISKVGDIVEYLAGDGMLQAIKDKQVIETDMSQVFTEPLNLNHTLWTSGNNFFFYCIYYGFRKNVVPYDSINSYITKINTPMLYSADYFESLEQMNEKEIALFLKNNPVILGKGAIIHGKHRACAMIGNLIAKQSYIPVYVKEKVSRF